MVQVLYVGNRATKLVKDRESGTEYRVPSDPHEPDLLSCDLGFPSEHFTFLKGTPTEVPDTDQFARSVTRLRGNRHFLVADADGNFPEENAHLTPPSFRAGPTAPDDGSMMGAMQNEIDRLTRERDEAVEAAKRAVGADEADVTVVTDEG